MPSLRSAPAVAVGLVAAVLAGCGGEEETTPAPGSPASESAALPSPNEPIGERIPDFERATSRPDCGTALELVHRVLLTEPEGGETKRNCRDALYALRQVEDFRATDSQELGPAAVVDGETGGEEVSLTWALDAEGSFKWGGSLIPEAQVGTEPSAGADFEQNAAAFVEALRDEDCEAAFGALNPKSRLSYGNSEKDFCKRFEDNFTAAPEGFGSRLQEDPDAELIELGATEDAALYGVATEPAGYRTIVVSGAGDRGDPWVHDVLPAER